MLNKFTKIVAALLLFSPLLHAQETRIYRDGANWTREMTGSLPAARKRETLATLSGSALCGSIAGFYCCFRISDPMHDFERGTK